MARWWTSLGAAVAAVLLSFSAGLAGEDPIEVTPPGLRLSPEIPAEQSGSLDREVFPRGAHTVHSPAFLEPFTLALDGLAPGARLGLSAWTAPAGPFGPDEVPTGAAFGLSFVWSTPVASDHPPETRGTEPGPTRR
jgi:hypothetical protein